MNSPFIAEGTVEGTGSAINVPIGFIPRSVEIQNIDDAKQIFPVVKWSNNMAAASGFKSKVNRSFVDAGVVEGTVSKKEVKTAVTTVCTVDNAFAVTFAAAETAFTATTDDITAVAGSVQEAVYLLCIDAAGAATLVKGATSTGAGTAQFPNPPLNKAVIGHVRIAVDAGSTDFNATTDDLDAAHLTVTYTDYSLSSPVKIIANGISEYAGAKGVTGAGFTIGADADVNVSGETITYIARG